MSRTFDRRTMLRYLAASAGTTALGSGCTFMTGDSQGSGSGGTAVGGGFDSPLSFHSPDVPAFVDAMPRLPILQGSTFDITARNADHRFHRDLPLSPTFAYDDASYLGPILEAQRDVETTLTFLNDLGEHVFAADIDTTVHGVTEMDRIAPRSVLHLHGGVTPPDSDGHPHATLMPGEAFVHRYPNQQDAACLWYHDHAMGITRLNAYAGLASLYYLRDPWDTGLPDNPLGLPALDFEMPLVLQEKVFDSDGYLRVRTTPLVPEGSWEGGGAGDVGVVNGVVWPDLKVARGLYRFRLINAGSFSVWNLFFDNGMQFWVIGNDGGLLDAPVATRSLRISPGERVDLLVDFRSFAPGDSVVLCNDEPVPGQAALVGQVPMPFFCRFTATTTTGFLGSVPSTLRGGRGQPPSLPPMPRPTRVRNVTLSQLLEWRLPPAIMSLNNLTFESEDIEMPVQGTVEQWNIINTTSDPHPVHLHLVNMRVLGRQPFAKRLYTLRHPRPPLGTRWAPSAERFVTAPLRPAAAWESGNKDTVLATGNSITRVVVRWPTADELGFDPDAMFHGMHDGVETHLQGYVWHCHIFDHEDHDMMLRFRVPA